MKSNQKIEYLFQRYLNNECTGEEIQTLLQFFGEDKHESLLRELIRKQLEEGEHICGRSENPALENVFNNIKKRIDAQHSESVKPSLPLYLRPWFRRNAAAAIIILLSATAYFLIPQKRSAAIVLTENKTLQKDIAPGKDNAILTLDDGTTIVLDSAQNGTLATEGNTMVLKMNGQIAYNKTGDKNAKPVYNTITTDKGNQYQIILVDGTRIWLNAASSIRFPTSFSGNERRVEITGEAYFEVAKNPVKPFKVNFKNGAGEVNEIVVLGTHFNVNTYSDEPVMKATLLEGSVKIKAVNKIRILSPGQQASITSDGIEIKKKVDINKVMAWKNGYFLFNNTDIYTLMRQVARWYDIQIKYEGEVTGEGFSGKISRNVPLSTLTKVLKLNDVQVKTEGRTMIIGTKVINN